AGLGAMHRAAAMRGTRRRDGGVAARGLSVGPTVMADAALLAGSRAVLVGVSAYEYAEFPPIRAARNSLEAMGSLLSDPALCAWPPVWVTVLANPISAE